MFVANSSTVKCHVFRSVRYLTKNIIDVQHLGRLSSSIALSEAGILPRKIA